MQNRVDQRALLGGQLTVLDGAEDRRYPDALVEHATELGVLGSPHARVVQRNDFPLVVEHR